MRQLDSQSYCYDTFRRPLPPEVFEILKKSIYDYNKSTLLDLASGTGEVVHPLLRLFHEIIAVEPNKEMMALAKRKLIPEMPADTSIRFVTARAEDFLVPEGWQASLTTIARAFHKMEQAAVLQRLERVTTHDGVIVIIDEPPFWHGPKPWQKIMQKMVNQLLEAQQKTDDGEYQPDADYTTPLKESAFSEVDEQYVTVTREWNFEQMIGFLYSTDFAAHKLFGERASGFERAIQQNLWPHAENGSFTEQTEIRLLIARRPH